MGSQALGVLALVPAPLGRHPGNNHGNNSMSEEPQGEAAASPAKPRLRFTPVGSIERLPEESRWLVEGFLSAGSLTVIAAAPKVGKTYLCLALAIAVATGTQAMGRYQVGSPGRVLIFPAEDDPRAIRERMEALCLGQHLELTADLAVDLITAESLKLDDPQHREQLEELIQGQRPRLLILDPLVRLHSGAESSTQHMSELFGYLRQLTRRYQLSIVVTHHLAKSRTGAGGQPGHAMRGSGDIHAAYDHGATLVRQEDGGVLLTLEHRTAASPDPVAYRLVSRQGGGMVFDFSEPVPPEPEVVRATPSARKAVPLEAVSLPERVLELLRAAEGPLSQVAIRSALKVRNAVLSEVLHGLSTAGRIQNLGRMGGWVVAEAAPS